MLQDLSLSPSQDAIRQFFSARHLDTDGSLWDLLCAVDNALQQEIQQEPGASFVLSEEDRHKMFYPLLKSLSEAASRIKDFQKLFNLYGQAAGCVPLDHTPSLHTIYKLLDRGQHGVDTLAKTLFIAQTYYQVHANLAITQPVIKTQQAIQTLWDYFQPNQLLLSEILHNEYSPIGLSYLKDDIYRAKDLIMEMDQGRVQHKYRNTNGMIVFFANGAVHVTIDAQVEGAKGLHGRNETLWHEYSQTMHNLDIATNSGSFQGATVNTYTIPPGADLGRVLEGLVQATFITDREKRSLQASLGLS